MSKKTVFAVTFLLVLLTMNSLGGIAAYANDIQPVQDASTVVKWNVIHATESAFSMYFTGAGNCLIEEGSTLTFSVGNIDEDVEGLLSVGNVSIMANDTDISRDFVLGVGIFSAFEPGLFVKAGATNIDALNDSAYASAARISGNFMNGTMSSTYHNATVNQIEYEVITFEYEQDTPLTGTPQITTLTYAIDTGVLIYANTRYWFGVGFEPYLLEIAFLEITHDGGYIPPTSLYPIIIASVIIILLIAMIVRKRM